MAIARETGDRRAEGTALGNLGSAHAKLGDAQRAIDYYQQSLAIAREIGDTAGTAFRSYNVALLYQRRGDATAALPLAQQAASAFAQIGHAEYAQRAQQLVEKLQNTQRGDDSAVHEDMQKAFVEFQLAGSKNQMQRVVARYPYMTGTRFMAVIEQFIASQAAPWQKPALTRRLAWLREIAEGH
jgi:tetratricopeptide (TPR) repeat protein